MRFPSDFELGFFTLAIGRLFRVESLTLVKIMAVLTRYVPISNKLRVQDLAFRSFGGVVLVSLSDSSGGSGPEPDTTSPGNAFGPAPIAGDFLALFSALFYALYVTLLKVGVKEESRVDMQLFFGFVGLFNVLFSWPVGLLLHLVHVERFELPTSNKVMVAILINVRVLNFLRSWALVEHANGAFYRWA